MKALATLFFFIITFSCSAGEVNFHQGDIASLLAKAKEEGKPVLIDAYTTWCGPCKMLDKEVFQDEEAAVFINENFIPYKLDMEKGEGPWAAMKFRISSYPTTIFLTSEGLLLSTSKGYGGKDGYLKKCRNVLNDKVPYDKVNAHQLKLEYPEFLKARFGVDGLEKKNIDKKEINEYLKEQDDLMSEVNWSVIYLMARMDHDYVSWAVHNSKELEKIYPKDEVTELIRDYISRTALGNIHEKGIDVSAKEERLDKVLDSLGMADAKDIRSNLLINLYYFQQEYGKLLNLLNASGEKHLPTLYNSICWGIFENSDDSTLINMAIEQMHKAIAEEPNPMYIDTLAHLYYKAGQKEEARKHAEDALKKANEQGIKMQETEELLEKLKG